MSAYQDVLTYWFGNRTGNLDVINEKSSLWWKKDESLDKDIKQRFGPDLQRLKNGELTAWDSSTQAQLAMIILADQFSRNIYRNTPESFAADPLAVSLTIEGMDTGKDLKLRLVERIFFYMPLMHAESIELQDKSVAKYTDCMNESTEAEKKSFHNHLDYAIKHRDIIERFGRFPHRNKILDRGSISEEIEFLKQPGSSF